MGNPWFESVAVAQRRAERILPRHVYDALIAGSEAGLTLDDNRAAYRELGFQPVIADRPSERHLATSVVGLDLSMPVMISPTGVQAVHPDGELAVARAAAARGHATIPFAACAISGDASYDDGSEPCGIVARTDDDGSAFRSIGNNV